MAPGRVPGKSAGAPIPACLGASPISTHGAGGPTVATGVGTNHEPLGNDPLEDYPVPVHKAEAQRDLRYGQMAVVIHRREDWPGGAVCRNCHEPWACRLHRWGLRVLQTAGWNTSDIAVLVR